MAGVRQLDGGDVGRLLLAYDESEIAEAALVKYEEELAWQEIENQQNKEKVA